jgi:CHASE2 domain-containing sensor protein
VEAREKTAASPNRGIDLDSRQVSRRHLLFAVANRHKFKTAVVPVRQLARSSDGIRRETAHKLSRTRFGRSTLQGRTSVPTLPTL